MFNPFKFSRLTNRIHNRADPAVLIHRFPALGRGIRIKLLSECDKHHAAKIQSPRGLRNNLTRILQIRHAVNDHYQAEIADQYIRYCSVRLHVPHNITKTVCYRILLHLFAIQSQSYNFRGLGLSRQIRMTTAHNIQNAGTDSFIQTRYNLIRLIFNYRSDAMSNILLINRCSLFCPARLARSNRPCHQRTCGQPAFPGQIIFCVLRNRGADPFLPPDTVQPYAQAERPAIKTFLMPFGEHRRRDIHHPDINFFADRRDQAGNYPAHADPF